MIPILYDKTGAVKIGDLNDCIECLVEEERNGIFELTMVYPANSSILESIVYDNIIVADANDYLKSQKFRIYNTRKLMANRIEICARHISFDLVHDWVDSISVENQSCEYALNTIFRNSQFSSHFKGHSDIINAQNFKVNKVTCLEAIGGTSGSILDTYGTGAEILRDNTDIHVLNRRGRDNDVVIEYRKNLTGLEVEEDTTDLVTRIMPYAIYTNSNDEEIEVRGDFIDSPLIDNYAHPYVKYMDYSEKFEDDEVPTKTKLNNLAAKEYINNKVDIPKNNYKIEFIPLSKCAGYEGLEDRINLCDVVTIKDSRYSIDTQAKVIKVVFDVLRGRYDSMELGEPRTTLGDIIGGTGDGPTQGPPGPPGPQGPAGADGSIGDFPQSLPAVPQITAKVYGFANIELSWTFENKVYYSYELYASKTKGFAPNTFNLIFSGQVSTFSYQVNPNETWYFRACALNTHGQRTEFSEEVEVSTVKISDLSNYVASAAIGDALIGELNLGRGWYGELRGNYIDARQLSVTDGSGKRTLDIDSFGNVSLDVASLKIKSSSVATQLNVGNAINDIKVGGTNLWVLSDIITGYESNGNIIGDDAQHKTRQSLVATNGAAELVYQCWNPNKISNDSNTNRVAFFDTNGSYITSYQVDKLNGQTHQKQLIKIPENAVYMRLGAICGVSSYDGTIKIKFELGNKATDFSPAPEDTESDITILESETKTLKESVTSLQLGADSINASVKSLEETVVNTTNGLANDISSIQNQVNLAMTSDDVKIEIQKEISKGANKVSTSTGFTFDDNGLKVSKSDSEMSTQITEDGMTVYRNDEAVLTANNQGVDAKNLRATTYLIIGSNSRMEDFTCNNDKRTGCFWIGD